MSVDNKAPEIRFDGFSGEWVENNLGELIDIRSAARVHKEQWAEAGVPFFRTSDVVSIYKGQENTKVYISHEIYNGLSEKIGKVAKDDLLITGGGSIGIPYLVPNDNPLYFKDADLLWLKNNKKFNGYFLYTFFFSECFKKHIKSISHTGTIAHYTIEQAKATPINTCNDEEQTQIGNYFQKLDALINQHQQKHDKLNSIKKAMLEKMFPKQGETIPEIRFKGFSGEWEEKKLFDEAIVTTGFPFDSAEFSSSGDYLVITNGNIQNNSAVVDGKAGNRIASDKIACLSQYILNIGDILITMDGSVGRTAKVIETRQILAQRVGRLVAKNNTEFLYQSLNTGTFLEAMTTISHGGTIKHISLSEISNYALLVPKNLEEQVKIGNYLKKLDDLIAQHQQQITKLNNIKQACLSKMFV